MCTLACCAANGRTVLFITERAVFRLLSQREQQSCGSESAIELIEVAPGIDIGGLNDDCMLACLLISAASCAPPSPFTALWCSGRKLHIG
jgi:hypothetical protein